MEQKEAHFGLTKPNAELQKTEPLEINAHAGSRTRVTSMGGLYDAATLHAHAVVLQGGHIYRPKGAALNPPTTPPDIASKNIHIFLGRSRPLLPKRPSPVIQQSPS